MNWMYNAYIENKKTIIMGDFNKDLLRPEELPERLEISKKHFLSLIS